MEAGSNARRSQVYGTEFDLCDLLQTLSLSKGKTKVSTIPSWHICKLDFAMEKGSRNRSNSPCCPLCLAKGKRGRCKHRGSGVPRECKPRYNYHSCHLNLQPSSPTRNHQVQSPAPATTPPPLPRPPHTCPPPPPQSRTARSPHATSSNPPSLRSPPTHPSCLHPRTLTQRHTSGRRAANTWI